MRVIDMECSVPKSAAGGPSSSAPASAAASERPAGYGMANYGRIFRSREGGGDARPVTELDAYVEMLERVGIVRAVPFGASNDEIAEVLSEHPDRFIGLARIRGLDVMRGVPGVPEGYDAGITRGLGVPSAFYHFAFEAGSEAGLLEKRNELIAKGVDVTDVVDHDWARSIYFKDPNGLQLEYCYFSRNLNDNDARMQDRFEMTVKRLGLDDAENLQPTAISARA